MTFSVRPPVSCLLFCKENLGLFKATEGSAAWSRYIEYVDELVLDGLFNAVHCSLAFLLIHTDSVKVAEGACEYGLCN